MSIRVVWRTIGLAAGAVLYAAAAVWNQVRVNPGFPSDVAIYFDAVRKASGGGDPYSPFRIGSSFVYPPPALFVVAPFAALSGEWGPFLWAGFGIVCYVASVAVLVEIFRPSLPARDTVGLTAFALLFSPFLEAITVGQINPFVLLGISLFVLGLAAPQYEWIGDLGLALAATTKISPLILVAIPLIRRDWRRCGRILGGLVAFSAISVWVNGPAVWRGFFDVFPKLLSGYPETINQAIGPTLKLAIGSSGWPAGPDWISRIFSLLVMGIFVAVVWRRRGEEPAGPRLAALGVASMTIASQLIWHHHLTFLVIPIVAILLSPKPGKREGLAAILVVAAVCLIQADRYVGNRFGVPPVSSIAGYLLVFVACLTGLGIGGAARRPVPAP